MISRSFPCWRKPLLLRNLEGTNNRRCRRWTQMRTDLFSSASICAHLRIVPAFLSLGLCVSFASLFLGLMSPRAAWAQSALGVDAATRLAPLATPDLDEEGPDEEGESLDEGIAPRDPSAPLQVKAPSAILVD